MSTDNPTEKPVRNPAEGIFNEVGGVAVAAILNIFRLAAAELVLFRSKASDPAWFEQAVQAKLDQFTSPTRDPHAHEAGLACARHLINQVLVQIRAQADIKKSLTVSEGTSTESRTEDSLSKLLH